MRPRRSTIANCRSPARSCASRQQRSAAAEAGAENNANHAATAFEISAHALDLSAILYAPPVPANTMLIHGEKDSNSGTFPIQSERFYMALKGHGATVRYVTLPHESHGYAARESVLHTVAEMLNWANEWAKGAKPRPTTSQQR